MNFPMDDPLFRFLFWLINTPGIGGVAVLLVGTGSLIVYSIVLRWIASGARADEAEVYSFPTPTLLEHEESE
jgi:hypothetical protein